MNIRVILNINDLRIVCVYNDIYVCNQVFDIKYLYNKINVSYYY